jgi:hypothetical protein
VHPGELGSALQELVVDVQRGTHIYHEASIRHLIQGSLGSILLQRPGLGSGGRKATSLGALDPNVALQDLAS